MLAMLRGFPLRLTIDSFNRRSNIHRALIANPGAEIARDARRIYARDLEVPSGGGVGTARAIGSPAATTRESATPARPEIADRLAS